jgi:hypothetical protein
MNTNLMLTNFKTPDTAVRSTFGGPDRRAKRSRRQSALDRSLLDGGPPRVWLALSLSGVVSDGKSEFLEI